MFLQSRELRIVAVEHHGAAGLDTCKDFRLGIGNRLDAGKELQMHRLHRGDHGHLRPHHLHQRLDFAGVIHADFEDRETHRRRTSRQRQRHAPVIVERRGRGVCRSLRVQHPPQRLLGGGLADRAGDRDHLRMEPRARGISESNQTGQHVIHHQQRRVARELVALCGPHHRQRCTGLQRRGDEIMAVVDVALDGEIGFTRRDGAAVDGKARYRFRQRAIDRGAHRLRHRDRGPQWRRAHAPLGANAAATAS